MRPPDTGDPLSDALAAISPLTPDPSRTDAVRRRCRETFVRQAARAGRGTDVPGAWTRVVAPLLIGAFSALYVTALFAEALRVEGWLS